MSRRWASRPLALRLGAVLALGTALTAAFVTAATMAMAWLSAEDHVRDDAHELARTLAWSLRNPQDLANPGRVAEAVALLRTRPQVAGVWVHDNAGLLVHAWGSTPPDGARMPPGGLLQGSLWVDEDISANTLAPGGSQLGRVVLHIDLGDQRDALVRQAKAASAAALAGLLLALVISRRLALPITAPVAQLAKAASAIARDQHHDLRLPEGPTDEVGVAVRAFNHMLDEVQRRDQALGEVNRRLERQAQDAQEARRQAEAASQAKTRFLANMSHELRSPLNGVIGAAQLLQLQGADPARRDELVEIIRTSGGNLLGLIERVLDLARIEAGALQVQADDFNLLDCVDAAVLGTAAEAQAKGLALSCRVDPGVAEWRHGDGARVRQLLLNLLGNAVKFTLQGEVSLDVSLQHDDGRSPSPNLPVDGPSTPAAGAPMLRLAVRDTGIGISPAAQAMIFEPFAQADPSTTRRFGGSGLGLAICHELALRMGGRIELASQPGQGSCFALLLPLPEAQQAYPAAPPLRLRVAWCEPHAGHAAALDALLLRLGCHGQRMASPQALRAFMAQPDEQGRMPWLLVAVDSAEGRALLSASAAWLDPGRVIRMAGSLGSAGGSPQADPPDADDSRWTRLLGRPLLRSALASRLDRLAGMARQATAAADFSSAGPGTGAAISRRSPNPLGHGLSGETDPAPDTTTAAPGGPVLLVEDDPINQAVVQALLQQAGYRCALAANGQAALALLQQQHFGLVLMDWQMPDMDGLQATRLLRAGAAGPAARQVPVVALTANAFEEDRQRCLAAGMDDFVSKPVLAAHLLAVVARWVLPDPLHSTAGAAATAAAAAAAAAPDEPDFDPQMLASLPMVADGSDPGFADELLQMFDNHARTDLAAAAQALAAGDTLRLQHLAHSLKSSAGQVGARALSAEAARLEQTLRQGGQPAADCVQRLQQHLAALQAALQARRPAAVAW